MTKILIASTDTQFARMLNYTLTYNGFIVESVHTPQDALKYVNEIYFNLILVDFDFYSNCRELKGQNRDTSLVVMGECYEEMSILEDMYSGMDDYILKPFGLQELKMVVNKQLERKRLMMKPIVYGDLRIDVARSLVTVKDKMISLGRKEMEILIIMTRKAGKIVTRDRLITEERIFRLKKKLEVATGEALQIISISKGYKLISLESC